VKTGTQIVGSASVPAQNSARRAARSDRAFDFVALT